MDGSGELSEEELEQVVDWLLDITGEDLEVTTAHHTPHTTHHTKHHASPPHSSMSCTSFCLVYTARGQGLGQASADDQQGAAQQGRRNDHRTRYFFGVVRMYVLCCGFSAAIMVCNRRRHADTRLFLRPLLLQRKSSASN